MKVFLMMMLFIATTSGFQNCSGNEFETYGNGQPYEGLTPTTGTTERTEDDKPDTGANDTNRVELEPDGFQILYLCQRPNSRFFSWIKFGYLKNGSPMIIFKKIGAGGMVAPWNEMSRVHEVDKDYDNNHYFDRAAQAWDFKKTGRLWVRLYDMNEKKAVEKFICN